MCFIQNNSKVNLSFPFFLRRINPNPKRRNSKTTLNLTRKISKKIDQNLKKNVTVNSLLAVPPVKTTQKNSVNFQLHRHEQKKLSKLKRQSLLLPKLLLLLVDSTVRNQF